MIGTPEQRRANREARAAKTRERNLRLAAFEHVQPGTIEMLQKAKAAKDGLSMDRLLYSLIMHARRTGWLDYL